MKQEDDTKFFAEINDEIREIEFTRETCFDWEGNISEDTFDDEMIAVDNVILKNYPPEFRVKVFREIEKYLLEKAPEFDAEQHRMEYEED